MSQPPRVRSEFHGTEVECLQQAGADAQRAAQNGYVPIQQTWGGEGTARVLTVVYEYRGVASATAWVGGGSDYPVRVTIDESGRINRLWGIPLFGWWARLFILIPHGIILSLYGMLLGLALLVTWIPILVLGRFPQWGYGLVGGYLRWYTRVAAYALLMAVPYPPFSTASGYAVEVEFDRDQRINRLWGIPLLGLWVRIICLIPHAIALWLVGIAAGIISLFAWIPVLIYGRYPRVGYQIVGGYLRWSVRVQAWAVMMVGPYPPFQLDN